MSCPNINSPEWKALTKQVSQEKAYELWRTFDGNVPQDAIDQALGKLNTAPLKAANQKLDAALRQVLTQIGIKYEAVDSITDDSGRPIDAIAKADLINKVIQVVEGKASADTLPEEAFHFLVEALDKNSHTYKSMYESITKFPEYTETRIAYENAPEYNEDSIRKEAMAKLLANELLKASESTLDPRLKKQALSWWNMVLAKLKQMFSNFNKEDFNQAMKDIAPFRAIAQKVLEQDLADFANPIKPTHSYYQLAGKNTPTAEQQAIINALNEGAKGIRTDSADHGYTKDTKKLGPSVTTRRDAKFDKRLREKTKDDPAFQTKMKEAGKIGTLIHHDLNNIIKRILSKDASVQKVVHTNPIIYAKLEVYVKELAKNYPTGTVFISEQIVYDATTDTPGTIDFLVITPDGTVDMYDWKTMNIGKQEKEVYGEPMNFKTAKYEWQLNAYRQILNSYGIKKFKKIRYVPIETKFELNKAKGTYTFKGIDIGSADPDKNKDKTYLNPVPVSEEVTGIEEIDELINKLKALHTEIETKRTLSSTEREKKIQRLTLLKKSIRDLQLNRSLGTFEGAAKIEFQVMEAKLKDSTITEAEVADMIDHLKIYQGLNNKFARLYRDNKIPADKQPILRALESKADELASKARDIMTAKIIEAAKEIGLSEDVIRTPQKPIGLMAKVTTALSRIDHPLFKTLWNLISKSKTRTMQDTKVALEGINEKLAALKEEARAKGLSGTAIFDIMVDKESGRLISKYSQEYYKTRNAKRKADDYQWIKANSVIDLEGLQKFLKEKRDFINSHTFSNDKAINEAIKKAKLKEVDESFDLTKSNKAYLTNDPYLLNYIKPADKWISPKYTTLTNNKAAFEFYTLFTDKMKEFSKFMPLGKEGEWVNPERFIPNIRQDLVERVMNSGGIEAIRGMGEDFANMFDYEQDKDATFGQINEFTGEYEKRIPAYFIGKGDAAKKSYDLGLSLALFTKMAYNYKHMSEIEGATRNLRTALIESKETALDGAGKVIQNALSNKVVSKVIAADTITQYDDFVNYYVYGVKQKDDWGYWTKRKEVKNPETGEIEVQEQKISKNKLAGGVLKTFAAGALGLNISSGIANFVGTTLNTVIIAAGGNFFSKTQWMKSMAMMSKGNFDPKVAGILKAMDLEGEKGLYNKINDLSINDISRKIGVDDLFVLLSKADKAVASNVTLSLMQNFGLDANKKLKKLDKLPAGTKSLLESIEVDKDGKLNLTTLLDENEFRKFKNKVGALTEKITGMSTRDNVSGYRLTLAGQALMQFRGWIPRTVGARFGESRYDNELEIIEKGRYISFWQQLYNKRFLPLVKEMLLATASGEFGQNTKDTVRLLYLKFLEEHPEVDPNVVTEEMFYESHVANVKATMMEIGLILIVTGLALGAKGLKEGADDDEPEYIKNQRSYFSQVAGKIQNELTFYISAESFQSVIKGGVPVFGLFTNLQRFGDSIVGEAKGQVQGDEELKEKSKVWWSLYRLLPTGSTAWALFGED